MEAMEDKLDKIEDHMKDFHTSEFNIFDFSEQAGRPHVIKLTVTKAVKDLGLLSMIQNDSLVAFLRKISGTYDYKVQYHNDLHGADVMQQAVFLLTTCNLQTILNLNKLDNLCFIIAAVCHDLGHDGFGNNYHVNAITPRAIDSNDGAVQEVYHSAELFRILSEDKYNFARRLRKDEFRVFRRRVIGLILATDMANHMSHLNSLNAVIGENNIRNGQNVDKLINDVDGQAFKHQ